MIEWTWNGLRCENALPERWFDLRGADFSNERYWQ